MKIIISMMSVILMLIATHTFADSKWIRLSWDGSASQEATISFTTDGSVDNPYLSYGYSTDENTWDNQNVTFTTSMESISSQHVRLSNLRADSAIYFRVCDSGGCDQRFWFKTAPDDNSPFVFVAGGDTRTGWTNRQEGNELISKIRPLFIMHGGDFTNSNNNSEWSQWFEDWELTYSDDTINGISYKRIYPLVSTHGNHEDDEIETICRMFGVDATRNSSCSANNTYYATKISPLLRVYTLNSQFMNESTSLQNAQNSWLEDDLSQVGASSTWRIAQYHKPMFPHYTGKSDNEELFDWWADDFFDYAVNIVVESDTHITKITEIVEPRGDDFAGVDNGVVAGTVYVGEGSWGAPSRSANDPKSWTVDLASIQQFKVITVTSTAMDVRTAQFDDSAQRLSAADRAADPTLLPNSVNWWSANGVGEVLSLAQDENKRSILSGAPNNGTSLSLSAVEDAFISSGLADTNFGSSDEQLLSDGSDSDREILDTLIKWDVSSIPGCAKIESAQIQISVFNASSGTYELYAGENAWSENNVTWNSIGGSSQKGASISNVSPADETVYTIVLNTNGESLVESWLSGNNNGIVISSNGTSNGIDIHDRENGPAAKLLIAYHEDGCQSGQPTAGYSFNVNNQSVSFTDTSEANNSDIESWHWDFDDTQTSEQQNPIHTYVDEGIYNVTLTVTAKDGGSATHRGQVTVTREDNGGEVIVTASSNDGNGPDNVVDENLGTRWSASGNGEWLQFELPEEVSASGMAIAFFNGDQRQAYFILQASANGSNWTNVTAALSSAGDRLEKQAFAFSQIQTARFFRYVGSGNSANSWNSITELSLILGDELSTPTAIQLSTVNVNTSSSGGNGLAQLGSGSKAR